MTGHRGVRSALIVLLLLAAQPALADRLVFGSFRSADNAAGYAERLRGLLDAPVEVVPGERTDGTWYRVCSGALDAASLTSLRDRAQHQGLTMWVDRATAADRLPQVALQAGATGAESGATSAQAPPAADAGPLPGGQTVPGSAPRPPPANQRALLEQAPRSPTAASNYADLDLGLQARGFSERGLAGQDRFQPSVSARFEYQRGWNDDRERITFTPFARYDAIDDERTHGDLRELYYTRVGDAWELHVGLRQIFWGVTEFSHLVDVINQTDLVENIDGEDKLGQPMIELSLVRDWGIVDLFLLTGFRERTYPGADGRLPGLPFDTDDPHYESGAGQSRIDGAVRWSHYIGPVNFGLYHFSGTNRDPRLLPEMTGGELMLRPAYDVIDQTGFDGQAIVGDWAWKLEVITRSGDGDRYYAFNAGFERTLVGVLGGRGDLGVVAEYMYDERDERAHNTLFEHDLALGGRWRANDVADTTALVGVIWDVRTEEYQVSVEASRRFGDSWTASLEGRLFAGAPDPRRPLPALLLEQEYKSLPLQDDDFVQLELTRYF